MKSTRVCSSSPIYSKIFLLTQGLIRLSTNAWNRNIRIVYSVNKLVFLSETENTKIVAKSMRPKRARKFLDNILPLSWLKNRFFRSISCQVFIDYRDRRTCKSILAIYIIIVTLLVDWIDFVDSILCFETINRNLAISQIELYKQ